MLSTPAANESSNIIPCQANKSNLSEADRERDRERDLKFLQDMEVSITTLDPNASLRSKQRYVSIYVSINLCIYLTMYLSNYASISLCIYHRAVSIERDRTRRTARYYLSLSLSNSMYLILTL
jgi:hypothetical protein